MFVCIEVTHHNKIQSKTLLDAAEKMATKYNASKRVKFNEGDTVTVRVPPKDRGPCDMSRIPGEIIKVSGGFHKVKTEFGVLSRQLRSDELEKYDEKIVASEKDLQNLETMAMREAAKKFNS